MNPISPTTRVIGGRYVVLGELGRGGMGVVWRAEDRVMGRQVAVKELHLPQGLSPDDHRRFRERLLREARTAGRLNDPSIVTVYDVIADEGVDHIVMELIEARTLTEVVEANGPLDESAVLVIARQMLTALRTAHESGVVHRDVKPSNVMLASGGRVKLTDFGIAQAADDPRLTSTGAMVGSPGYMAPERLDGEPAAPASDLWALGATLSYALRGESPFTRDTTAATISAVLHTELPVLRTRSRLGSVINGLLRRPVADRIGAAEALAMLDAPVTGQQPVPEPATRTATTPSAIRRRPGGLSPWWAALVAVIALVAGGVGGFVLGAARSAPAAGVPTAGAPGTGAPAAGAVAYTYGEGGDLPAFELGPADCATGKLGVGTSFTPGSSTSCDEPHDIEVFAALTPFPSSGAVSYPGREALAAAAAATCSSIFGTDTITGPDKATLQTVAIVPSAAAFGRAVGGSYDTRQQLCVLHAADGHQLTGTRISPPAG
ncbi:serine/threonine-protein kinase [Pseudonocardia sp. GCM10023141]|uniref:serine/threonine-protein kinase n=1 Tax=Pseudonocardia sp. GCM10023141 TaxID=3252653 RepID=UPI00360FBBEB